MLTEIRLPRSETKNAGVDGAESEERAEGRRYPLGCLKADDRTMPQNKIGNIRGFYLLKNERFLSEPLDEKHPSIRLVAADCAKNETSLFT